MFIRVGEIRSSKAAMIKILQGNRKFLFILGVVDILVMCMWNIRNN